jgi:ornithine decarboxylase
MLTVEPWLTELVRETGTPHFIYDLHIIRKQIDKFRHLFPNVSALYSTKTNSEPAVIDTCIQKKMAFDAATLGEIEMLIARGAHPASILFTHPIKSVDEIKRAYTLGVRGFTADSEIELKKLQTHAGAADIFIRLIPTKDSSLYNYQHRLGAATKEARQLLDYATAHDTNVCGLSFHIGSQSMSIKPWGKALSQARKLLMQYYDALPNLRRINIGSGFPVKYDFGRPPNLEAIADTVAREIEKFPPDVTFLAEPGRILVGPAGILATSVIENVIRGKTHWLFTDTTVYSGLIERLESGGVLSYPITCSVTTNPQRHYNIAGKTLDPDDIISTNALLSAAIKAEDVLYIHKVGAYTAEFFTHYHSLPRPLLTFYDSEYAENVGITGNAVAHRGISAKRNIAKDETIFKVTGHRSGKRSRTSFQVGPNQHIEPNLFGAYLNHSCLPNAGIRTDAAGLLNVVAREPIKAGEEVTVDYAMFEYELADMAHVPCLCKTDECRGTILGYKDLSPQKKMEYKTYTASHLITRNNR